MKHDHMLKCIKVLPIRLGTGQDFLNFGCLPFPQLCSAALIA